MKKSHLKWLLFIGLMLLLAGGLSYLSYNRTAGVEQEQDVQGMSIALVNEDQGAILNSEEIVFGDAFVESIEKNDEHNWYVVSRGVAENGLENNVYDMMIVIPSDFSKKALSIQSQSPEHVVLNYKVNTSGDETVKSEAEKTASSILNNFNQQIIDVYFASIIGNLQDAQDHIADIVGEQAAHTFTYKQSIQSPLSNYTNQFESMKNYTDISRESFSGLEDLLASFDELLMQDTAAAEQFQESIRYAAEMQDNARMTALDFYQRMQEVQEIEKERIHHDINEQLRALEETNHLIMTQFEKNENERETFVSQTMKMQVHFKELLEFIEETEKYVQAKLNPDQLNNQARKAVAGMLDEIFPEGESVPVSTLFEQPDAETRKQINQLISRLPSLDPKDFEKVGLPKDTVQEIHNTIAVTKKYNSEIENAGSGTGETLADDIKRLKRHLQTKGVTVTDTVQIPKMEKSGTFKLTDKPDQYVVSDLSVQMPNGKVLSGKDGAIELPANKEGKLTVKATFRLADKDASLDIYEPIQWGWKVDYNYKTKTEEQQKDNKKKSEKESEIISLKSTSLPEVMSVSKASVPGMSTDILPEKEPKEDADPKSLEESEPNNPEPSEPAEDNDQEADSNHASDQTDEEPDQTNNKDENNSDKEDSTESEKDAENPPAEDEDGLEDDTDDSGSGSDSDEQEDQIETVEIVNHTIRHEVSAPVADLDNTTKRLVQSAIKTVSPYQKLASLYESYFGLDMGAENLQATLKKGRLTAIATDDSLYALFNKKDITNLMEDYIAGRAIRELEEEMKQPYEDFQTNISFYRELVETANKHTVQLAEKADEINEQAQTLNKELATLLEQAVTWREQSLNLIDQQSDDEQSELQVAAEEEQMAIMKLADDVQPLLSQSEALKSQAGMNLSSAETVYNTFNAIDDQATAIQESGAELIKTAETLSDDMTNKLVQDQEFVDRFGNVLENSRIGDRPNEQLYEFLSNPVLSQNAGVITAKDYSHIYYILLVCFIIALFTAYVISENDQKKKQDDRFNGEISVVKQNWLITAITGCIGIAEGLIIGIVSGYFLQLAEEQLLLWTFVIVIGMASMLYIAAYLLRQLKMFGMFLLLVVLSLYLFLSGAPSSLETLHGYSPLKHAERIIVMSQNEGAYGLAISAFIAATVVGMLANLFVIKRTPNREAEDESDESVQQAN